MDLAWTSAKFPDGASITYKVYLDKANATTEIANGISGTSYTHIYNAAKSNALEYNTTYY